MTARALLIEVRLPDGRFHGVQRMDADRRSGGDVERSEWPPSPFRLFQAMIAGAYGGRWAIEDAAAKDAAFAWLEGLGPPTVAAPAADKLAPVTYFVPNNDLDAKDGDPDRISEIRAAKRVRGVTFSPDHAILYAWRFEDGDDSADTLAALANRLHTLGRGVDQAYARAEVVDAAEAEQRLALHGAAIRRPSSGVAGHGGVPCPAPGSLDSLKARHRALGRRFTRVGAGRGAVTEFRQPPRPQFRAVAYDSAPTRLMYELKPSIRRGLFEPVRRQDAVQLVKAARDLAAARLGGAGDAALAALVDRAVLGRGDDVDPARRVRFIPLPSTGMRYTSPSIRRLLVEVPANCLLSHVDVDWALAGRAILEQTDETDGVVHETLLKPARDAGMARNYGVGRLFERWISVTPVVLPEGHGRTRGRSSGRRRVETEDLAAAAVLTALRHAGVARRPNDIGIQREPFQRNGLAADHFGPDRFDLRRLTHVSLTFAEPIPGPLLIGDGRFLGLGLFEGVRTLNRD